VAAPRARRSWNFTRVATSEDGQRVGRAAGAAHHPQRRQHELELVAAALLAGGGEVLEVAVVDEPQAHGDDADHVDRDGHRLVARGEDVLAGVAADHGHAPLVHPWEAGGVPPWRPTGLEGLRALLAAAAAEAGA